MSVKTILFDLDDTLYPPTSGLWKALSDRMTVYMRDILHIPEDEIDALRARYYSEYGTTLKGLEKFYGVKAKDYLEFVHDVKVSDYVQPDPHLRELLLSLPVNRTIFTNADRGHASRVTDALGITDCFNQVIDVMRVEPYCKPFPQAFTRVMEILDDPDPAHYLLVDDFIKSIRVAQDIGMQAIWVHKISQETETNHVKRIDGIHDLPAVWDIEHGGFHV